MHIKFILPALLEVTDSRWRSIKYSLFPPLSLLALAGATPPGHTLSLEDEHVEPICTDDTPDVVAMTVYITSAHRAYALADLYRRRGVRVILGGIHPTTLPDEALAHCDAVVRGPAETLWPQVVRDLEQGTLHRVYGPHLPDRLDGLPPARRDLIRPGRYLIPHTITVSKGCPHNCHFCYQSSFYGDGYYRLRPVEEVIREIGQSPYRHVFFLDDNLMGHPAYARALFQALHPLGVTWQGAASLDVVRHPDLLHLAYESGCRSLFVGFESLSQEALARAGKRQNRVAGYERDIRIIHDAGIMINASFIFGFDHDDPSVFERTVEFGIRNRLETATFHILTPYPGTPLFAELEREGRLLHCDWSRYDTRHAVFRPRLMSPKKLEEGYWWAYRAFYSYGSILQRSLGTASALRRLALNVGWKKVDRLWDLIIRFEGLSLCLPVLERVLRHSRTRRRDCGPVCAPAPNPRLC